MLAKSAIVFFLHLILHLWDIAICRVLAVINAWKCQ